MKRMIDLVRRTENKKTRKYQEHILDVLDISAEKSARIRRLEEAIVDYVRSVQKCGPYQKGCYHELLCIAIEIDPKIRNV